MPRSLELGLQSVIFGAEVLPILWRDLGLGSSNVVCRRFRKYDGEPGFQMPIDVTMQEPCARVSGEEPERRVSAVNWVNITPERVDEVGDVGVGRKRNIECMAV